MAILFAASETEAFTLTGNVIGSTTSGEFDSDFSRAGIAMYDGGIATVPIGNLTEIWVHALCYNRTLDASLNQQSIRIQDTASASNAICQIDFDAGTPNFEYWTTSMQELAATLTISATTLYRVDMHCKIVDTAGGNFTLYINEVKEAEFTGDTKQDDIVDIDQVMFRSPDVTGTSADAIVYSEIIIADEDTRGMRVATLIPTGDGNTVTFTGGWADVDEAGLYVDADFVTSGTATEIEQFVMSDLSALAGGMSPLATVESMRAKNAATGPQNLQFSMRSGTTDYASASVTGLGTSYGPFQNIRTVDPDTAAAWTEAGINAVQAGVKSIT